MKYSLENFEDTCTKGVIRGCNIKGQTIQCPKKKRKKKIEQLEVNSGAPEG